MGIFENLGKSRLQYIPYSNDRPAHGYSGQPYIQATPNDPLNALSRPSADGGLVRGGALGLAKAVTLDVARHLRYFSDQPKGISFITKQVGLQLCNPKLETRGIKSIQVQDSVTKIINKGIDFLNKNSIGPTRIYNGGINTLAQIALNGLGGHIDRHGIGPVRDEDSMYEKVVQFNDENGKNRLLLLSKKFQLGSLDADSHNAFISRRRLKVINGIVNLFGKVDVKLDFLKANTDSVIDSYVGGPNSFFGIGFTTIKRYYYTEDKVKIKKAFEIASNVARNIPINIDTVTALSDEMKAAGWDIINFPPIKNGLRYNQDGTKDYKALKAKIDSLSKTKATHYRGSEVTNVAKGEYRHRYSESLPEIIKLNRQSQVFNFTGKFGTINDFDRKYDSLILGFGLINPFTATVMDTVLFPGYLNSPINFNSNAGYNEIQYLGRPDSFFIYNTYSRQVTFGFDIPCFNPVELRERHRSLGQLESSLAGMYDKNGTLGGIIHKLHIGSYIKGEPGFIMDINYTIPQDITWDIDEQLAHNITVAVTFRFIHKSANTYFQGGGFLRHIPDGFTAPLKKSKINIDKDRDVFKPTVKKPNAIIK